MSEPGLGSSRPRTRLGLTLAAAACASSLHAERLPTASDPVVHYEISVRLDSVAKKLHGQETITWRNPSNDTVSELWFHLYLNAFKNNRSTFFRESRGTLRGIAMPEDGWGFVEVSSVRLADGRELVDRMSFEHPDDDNQDDRTVFRLPLPDPVAPGGSVRLEIDFQAQLPRIFARTGYHRDFYLVGQWFPKLGVYEPPGTRGRTEGGWNCHQFHAHSEFYADYGHYRVHITTPSSFVVGATGVETARVQNPDRTTTHTYEQADVHDFAWTADPEFVEILRPFSAADDVSPREYQEAARLVGRTHDEVRLSDVNLRLLIHRPRLPQAERFIEAAKKGLKHFGLWYGRYPYRTLTIVDPAFGAEGASGMEYPTFITAGTSMLLNRGPLGRLRLPEEVTVHEFGHQFWYGLVGNNEFEEAWLDEGLTSYSTGKVMDLAYGGESTILDSTSLGRLQNHPDTKFDAIRKRSWEYSGSAAYGFNSYQRPALALATLEGYLGEGTMARAMRTFHERWRFRHPSSDDFFDTISEVSGRDLDWFFGQVVESGDVLDYEVASVATEREPPFRGVAEGDPADPAAEPSPPFVSRVLVRRRGEVAFPVEIAFKFEGREEERILWDGSERWKSWEFERPERLEWASVDPERAVLLDVDWLNDGKRVRPDHRAATAWAARWLFWIQNVLHFLM
jgi:hypothetical protein